MEKLLLHVQKRLQKKNLTELSVGSFLLEICKKKSKKPDELSGFLKNNILFLSLPFVDDRMGRFMKRESLRIELNSKLEEMWYSSINVEKIVIK